MRSVTSMLESRETVNYITSSYGHASKRSDLHKDEYYESILKQAVSENENAKS